MILIFFCKVLGGCYFPVEVQGEYVTQSMIDSEIAYTSLTITYDSIPGEDLFMSVCRLYNTPSLQAGETVTAEAVSEVTTTSSRMSPSMGICATNVSKFRYIRKKMISIIDGTF